MAFHYHVYGLNLESELELPELIPARGQSIDFSVSLGTVPKSLANSRHYGVWAEHAGNRCLFRIRNVGRFLIEDGQSITVEPYGANETDHGAAASISDVRLYLLGSSLAALLHQRRLLPLHVSAVLSSAGVWAFTGPSGAGKSTVAGWLSQCAGLPLLSDDVSVVSVQDGSIELFPGPRKLKLWDDAVEFLDLKERRMVQDLSNTPKFQLYLPNDIPAERFELRGLIMLERAEPNDRSELIPVKGIDRFGCCCGAVYRHYMAPWFRSKEDYVHDVFQLAESIEILRFRRPWSLEQMNEEMNPLRDLLMPNTKKVATQ